jgi:hypothetical protein
MVKKNIIDAYIRIREIDNTIPDEVLDFMKDAAVEKLESMPTASEISKKYHIDEIRDEFDKLPPNEKMTILYEAIDVMQVFNTGRAKSQCVAIAMGYENHEGSLDTWEKIES